MMKTRLARLLFLVLALACMVGCAMLNPARKSESAIRERLLKKTPLGTPSTQVLAIVRADLADKAWSQPRYETRGAVRRSLRPYDPNRPGSRNVHEIIGTRSIRGVRLGAYWPKFPLPMVVHVFVSWAFNEADELIDIIVYKETDAP